MKKWLKRLVFIPTTEEDRAELRRNDPWIALLQKEEREKRRQQKAGWWCDWVPKKDRKP